LAQKTENEVRTEGGKAVAFRTDVTSTKDVQEMVRTVIESSGRIDVLVNNAGGTMGFPPRPLEDVTDNDWESVVKLNLFGVFNCCRAVVPHMKRRRYGKIINIGSGAGFQWGAMRSRSQAYASAKAGLMGFTRHIAYELAPWNINVNCVSPGLILTHPEYAQDEYSRISETIPLGRIGEPKDISSVVVFMASDEASYVTGQILMVDGGRIMR
jgi:3-oxoacyl-[acyl-carrier protein] reductase